MHGVSFKGIKQKDHIYDIGQIPKPAYYPISVVQVNTMGVQSGSLVRYVISLASGGATISIVKYINTAFESVEYIYNSFMYIGARGH